MEPVNKGREKALAADVLTVTTADNSPTGTIPVTPIYQNFRENVKNTQNFAR